MKRDWGKWWTFFTLAFIPSFTKSAFFTVIIPDWRLTMLCLMDATYQGLLATKALDSNPNKLDKPADKQDV